MKLIVGLGNPGVEYKHTRHNVGFCVVDLLSRKWGIGLDNRKFQARFGSGIYENEQVILLKPQKYMNNSGGSVSAVMRFYKLDPADILVIVDDMDLATGCLRLRAGGSAGGHNGLKDIIEKTGRKDFARLRIGISSPGNNRSAVSYVLGVFGDDERELIDAAVNKAEQAAGCWVREGIEKAMSKFNTPRKKRTEM